MRQPRLGQGLGHPPGVRLPRQPRCPAVQRRQAGRGEAPGETPRQRAAWLKGTAQLMQKPVHQA